MPAATLLRSSNRIWNLLPRYHRNFSTLQQLHHPPITKTITTRKIPIKRLLHSQEKRFRMPETPDLIYMPHVVRWATSKLRLKYLKRAWDPEFSEGAFIYGTTRAICRITEVIREGRWEQLDGLLTESARIKLVDDVSSRLSPNQRNIIVLRPPDVKILVPMGVTFTREGTKKVCTVGLRVLALKWLEQANEVYRLVLVALQTEFLRDYNDTAEPEWTISNFSVLECSMLTETTATR